uniref:Uncharacterized protein n=1 Tax=Ciona savignyi TaxID=51511 RepID=H2Z300_CIOSA
MKREKTVIDIHISEKEKDDFFKELNRKSQNYMDAFKKQQELNKLEVQKQIDARKKRKGAQVVELMNQLDRQKTMFHERTSLQLTRQKTELNRKIERIKTEKTIKGDQTMTSQEKRKGSKFLKLAQEANGEDEMDEFARNLQKKLEKENESALPAESVAPLPVDDKEEEKEEEEFRPRSSSRRLGKTDQDQIVKDRMLKRKKKRVHEDEAKEDRDDQ